MIAFSFPKDGLLIGEACTVHGKQRRFYRATPQGRLLLKTMKKKIEELYDEVMKHP